MELEAYIDNRIYYGKDNGISFFKGSFMQSSLFYQAYRSPNTPLSELMKRPLKQQLHSSSFVPFREGVINKYMINFLILLVFLVYAQIEIVHLMSIF